MFKAIVGYIDFLKRRKWVILILFLILLIGSIVANRIKSDSYRAVFSFAPFYEKADDMKMILEQTIASNSKLLSNQGNLELTEIKVRRRNPDFSLKHLVVQMEFLSHDSIDWQVLDQELISIVDSLHQDTARKYRAHEVTKMRVKAIEELKDTVLINSYLNYIQLYFGLDEIQGCKLSELIMVHNRLIAEAANNERVNYLLTTAQTAKTGGQKEDIYIFEVAFIAFFFSLVGLKFWDEIVSKQSSLK